MLKTILSYDYPGTDMLSSYWDRMIRLITTREEYYTRIVENGSLGVVEWAQLVKRMLTMVPIEILDEYKSFSSKSAFLMFEVIPAIEKYLAPSYKIRSFNSNFTRAHDNSHIQEFIFPCRSETPLMDLPLSGTLEDWKRISPIHIVYNDSEELCGNYASCKFVYHNVSKPRLVIATINCVALVFQYVAYAEDKKSRNLFYPKDEFIQDYVIHNLYEDMFRCWTLTVLDNVVSNTDVNFGVYANQNIIQQYMIDAGITDVRRIVDRVRSSVTQPGTFMNTKWLPMDRHQISIPEYIRWLEHNITFPILRQTLPIRFLMSLQILRITMMINYISNRTYYKTLNRQMAIKLRRMRDNGYFTNANYALADSLKKDVTELIKLSDLVTDTPAVQQVWS